MKGPPGGVTPCWLQLGDDGAGWGAKRPANRGLVKKRGWAGGRGLVVPWCSLSPGRRAPQAVGVKAGALPAQPCGFRRFPLPNLSR